MSILLDPVLSYPYESGIPRYTYDDLPDRIDFALINHNHQDHVLFETLLQLRHRIGSIVVPRNNSGALQDPSLKLMLKHCEFRNVLEVSDMDELAIESGSITAIPLLGEHGDLNVASKAAYLVRVGGHSLLFAADSCNVDPSLYEHVHREVGNVEVLFVGMECDGVALELDLRPAVDPEAGPVGSPDRITAARSAWSSSSAASRCTSTRWARSPGSTT